MAQGLNVMKTNGIPDMRVRVNPGCSIGIKDRHLTEGDEGLLGGPVALSFEADGLVTIIPEEEN